MGAEDQGVALMTPRAVAEFSGIWALWVGAAVEWLPTISFFLAAVWTLILIGEWAWKKLK